MEIRCPKCGQILLWHQGMLVCYHCRVGYWIAPRSLRLPWPDLTPVRKRPHISPGALLLVLALLVGSVGLMSVLTADRAAGGTSSPVRPTSTAGPRPATHQRVFASGGEARGTLTVDNGGYQDGFVWLSTGASTRTVAAGYVRSDDTLTLTGIPDGTYRLFFCTGEDWLDSVARFARDQICRRFVESFRYATTHGYTRVEWTTWTVSLHAVPAGTAETVRIDPAALPPLQ